MKYYLQNDIEAYVHDIAEKYFGECKVFVDFSNYRQCLPESFPTDATVEDYLKTGQACSFTVFISPGHITLEDAREQLKSFQSEFEKRSFDKMIVEVLILPDIESFEKTDSVDGPTGKSEDKWKYDWPGSFEVSK